MVPDINLDRVSLNQDNINPIINMSFCTSYPTLNTMLGPESERFTTTLLGYDEHISNACVSYPFNPMETWQYPALEDIPLDQMLSAMPCFTEDVGSYFETSAPAPFSMPALSPDTGSITTATTPSETSQVNLELSPKASSKTALPNSEMSPRASFHNSTIILNPSPVQSSKDTPPKRPRGRPRKYLADGTSAEPKNDSLDRYRAKNRRASAKCRERENTQTASLQKTVAEQSYRNAELKRSVAQLREELYDLEMSALRHVDCDYRRIQQYNEWKARDVANAWDLESKDDA